MRDMYSQIPSLFNTRQILINNFKQKKDVISKFLPKLLIFTTSVTVN